MQERNPFGQPARHIGRTQCDNNNNLGQEEAFREEHDLTNELKVGHHDNHWSEQGLDWFWKFSSSGVTRIHGDEDPHPCVQLDLLTFELKDYNWN